MYQSIYRYAVQNGLTAQLNRENRNIAAHIILDEDGHFQQVGFVEKKERESVLCPSIGTLSYGDKVNPICEKAGILFPRLSDEDITKKHVSWLDIMADGAKQVPVFEVVNRFIQTVEADEALMDEVCEECNQYKLKPTDWVSFTIVGLGDVETLSDWNDWFSNWILQNDKKAVIIDEDSNDVDDAAECRSNIGISCITGQRVTMVTNASFPAIMTSQTGTGSRMMSYYARSFQTYGIKDSSGTPASMDEALRIKAGLEHLLKSPNNHDDLFGVIYWYEHPDEMNYEDYIGMIVSNEGFSDAVLSEYEKRRAGLYDAAFTGELKQFTIPADERASRNSKYVNAKYHMMRFNVPSKGRFWVSEEHEASYGDLADAADQWLDDTALATRMQPKVVASSIRSLYRVLKTLLHGEKAKSPIEQMEKEFGIDRYRLLVAMVTGSQIPGKIYDRALRRLDRNMVNPKSDEKERGRQNADNLLCLQIIKVYLLRSNRKEYGNMNAVLNLDAASPAYHLGRMLAVVEKIQKDSSNSDKELTTTIANAYYSALKDDPTRMTRLVDKVQRAYMPRLKRQNKYGTFVVYERLLQEVQPKAAGMARRLNAEERGLFDLGYRQQKMDFYRGKSAEEDVDSEDVINEEGTDNE